jgi:hypothetical protein
MIFLFCFASFRFCFILFRFCFVSFRFCLFRFVSFLFRFLFYNHPWKGDSATKLSSLSRDKESGLVTVHLYDKWLCKTVHDLCLFLQTGNMPSRSSVSIRISNLTSQIDIEWSRLYGKIWLWKKKIIRISYQKAHHFPASCVLCKFLKFIEKKKYIWLIPQKLWIVVSCKKKSLR